MFARKHVSIISVSIAPRPSPHRSRNLLQEGRWLYGLPQNAIRDKTDKKVVRIASLYQLERFLRFGLSFRILAFRFAPPYS